MDTDQSGRNVRRETLANMMFVRQETFIEMAKKLRRQRDRWYCAWKWTFGALLVSVLVNLWALWTAIS